MREIVFDTETTGLSYANGDRIIEIGCVELHNRIPTGKVLHHYFNPQRYISKSAVTIHGLTSKFLQDKPEFVKISQKILDFFEDSPLIAHNASFDMGFLHNEMKLSGFKTLENRVIDTLRIAKQKFPRAPASLDALCKRFEIDLKERTKHGALLDAQLLAKVYLELMGGAQTSIFIQKKSSAETKNKIEKNKSTVNIVQDDFLVINPTKEQQKLHQQTLKKIKNSYFY